MPEYIEREWLITKLTNFNKHKPRRVFHIPDIVSILLNCPTADVVEVKHGKWIWKELYGEVGYMLVCSECEESEGACERYDYCPNCGAKMDGANERP